MDKQRALATAAAIIAEEDKKIAEDAAAGLVAAPVVVPVVPPPPPPTDAETARLREEVADLKMRLKNAFEDKDKAISTREAYEDILKNHGISNEEIGAVSLSPLASLIDILSYSSARFFG